MRKGERERISNFFNYGTQYDKRNEENRLVENDGLMNSGVAARSKVYHELGMDSFMNNRRRYENAQYNHNSIFKMLVSSRILYPVLKLAIWRGREAHGEICIQIYEKDHIRQRLAADCQCS